MYLQRKAAAPTAIGIGGGISNAVAVEVYPNPKEVATIDSGARRGSQPLPAYSFDGARNLPLGRISGAAVSSIVNLPIEEIRCRGDAHQQNDDVLAGRREGEGAERSLTEFSVAAFSGDARSATSAVFGVGSTVAVKEDDNRTATVQNRSEHKNFSAPRPTRPAFKVRSE